MSVKQTQERRLQDTAPQLRVRATGTSSKHWTQYKVRVSKPLQVDY